MYIVSCQFVIPVNVASSATFSGSESEHHNTKSCRSLAMLCRVTSLSTAALSSPESEQDKLNTEICLNVASSVSEWSIVVKLCFPKRKLLNYVNGDISRFGWTSLSFHRQRLARCNPDSCFVFNSLGLVSVFVTLRSFCAVYETAPFCWNRFSVPSGAILSITRWFEFSVSFLFWC